MDHNLLVRAERLVKNHVRLDISQVVERDRQLLSTLCGNLGMEASDANLSHVATLLNVMGVDTKQEYPKAIYDAKSKLLGVANDAKEEANIKPSDLTAQVSKTLNAPAPQSKADMPDDPPLGTADI